MSTAPEYSLSLIDRLMCKQLYIQAISQSTEKVVVPADRNMPQLCQLAAKNNHTDSVKKRGQKAHNQH